MQGKNIFTLLYNIKHVLYIIYLSEGENICPQETNCGDTSNEDDHASKDGNCGCSESRTRNENGKTSLNPEKVF